MAFPGMTLSPIRVSLGSGLSSGSSTSACLMLIPCSAKTLDAFARIPTLFGLSAVISTTPSPSCLAVARRDGQADSSFEKNRPDFSVTVNRSNRFAYCSAINSDCSSYFESWDLNLIDENPVPPNSESILQQELCDLQPFRMSLKENLDSLPHQRSRNWPFVLKNLKGVVLRTHQRYWN